MVLNVTSTGSSVQSFVTVWPTGESRPNASNLNTDPAKAVQPAGQDVGPEVAAELETGPYRVRYFKRFLRGPPATELDIHGPTPEQLAGRDAHDRFDAELLRRTEALTWPAGVHTRSSLPTPSAPRTRRRSGT